MNERKLAPNKTNQIVILIIRKTSFLKKNLKWFAHFYCGKAQRNDKELNTLKLEKTTISSTLLIR